MTLLSNDDSGCSVGRNGRHQYEEMRGIPGNALLHFSSFQIQPSALQNEIAQYLLDGFLLIKDAAGLAPYIPLLVCWALMKRPIPDYRRNMFRQCPGPRTWWIQDALKRFAFMIQVVWALLALRLKTASKILVWGLRCIHSPECLQQAYLKGSVYVKEIAMINHCVERDPTQCWIEKCFPLALFSKRQSTESELLYILQENYNLCSRFFFPLLIWNLMFQDLFLFFSLHLILCSPHRVEGNFSCPTLAVTSILEAYIFLERKENLWNSQRALQKWTQFFSSLNPHEGAQIISPSHKYIEKLREYWG